MHPRIDIWVQSAGLGHVTRQINLLDALRRTAEFRHAEVRFLVDGDSAVERLVQAEGAERIERPADMSRAAEFVLDLWGGQFPDIFVVDSVDHDLYLASATTWRQGEVFTVVVMDDPGNRAADGDLIVNAFPALRGASPPTGSRGWYLLGGEYFILNGAFASNGRQAKAISRKPGRGFAFFGGTDLEDITALFLDAATAIDGVDWTLLIGPHYAHAEQAARAVEQRGLPVRIVSRVDYMASMLQQADLAVLAGGNTLIEAAATGTPAVVVSQNDVQAANARYFAERCGVIDVGPRTSACAAGVAAGVRDLLNSRDARAAMSAKLRSEIDGRGAGRVASALSERWCRRP